MASLSFTFTCTRSNKGMNLSMVRTMLSRQEWRDSTSSDNDGSMQESSSSISTSSRQLGDDDFQHEKSKLTETLSDQEMLERAQSAYDKEDFVSLSAGPEANGPWKRIAAVDHCVVFKRHVTTRNKKSQPYELEVMCAGRLKASLEEVASILRVHSEAEHNASLTALHGKKFIFGSYDREVSCLGNQVHHEHNHVATNGVQLSVKTNSFTRTTMLGSNEQWCYFDYFQRKKEWDGFTILKRALPSAESTPGRIVRDNARVDQLHGLNASYLVDKLPGSKGLRLVFRAWFDVPEEMQSPCGTKTSQRRKSYERTRSNSNFSKTLGFGHTNKRKAQLRRLLAMAHGMTNIPKLVRRRRFGVQVPVNLDATHASNTRCPCCTCSLAPVKMSLAIAVSAIASRCLTPLKMDTRRCYLCGYRVCVDCWNVETMENAMGRVATIIVCIRCHTNVQACEYSEVFADTAADRTSHRGPPRVVEDAAHDPSISLLIDFLSTSLLKVSSCSSEHAAVVAVIQRLLRPNVEDNDDDSSDQSGDEYDQTTPCFKHFNASEAVEKVRELLSDEQQLPALEACKLGNAVERNYLLDLPDDPTTDVPRSPIPSNEADRIASVKAAGLLEFADLFAPESPLPMLDIRVPDVHDLEILCNLATKILDCAHSFVTIMCTKHEHVVVGTHAGFVGAAVPRNQTTCQHALMSPYPFMAVHHEADVRFHKHGATSAVPTRFYVGFPLKVSQTNNSDDVAVGMLCCIDSKPRAEISRTQYATMKRLANTASHFLLQKSRQLRPSS